MNLLRNLLAFVCLLAAPVAPAADDPAEQKAIATARQAIAEREQWPYGAELTAKPLNGGWSVIAWRIEFPEKKGAERFVPGGFRAITIAGNGKVTEYRRGH